MSIFKERLNSFRFAITGMIDLLRSTPNARIHLVAASSILFCAWFFSVSAIEWCILIFAITIVFSAEALNTSLEYLTDLVSPEYNELAGKAKDVAAGAVLLAAIGAAIVGFIIFLPKFASYFISVAN